MMFELVVLGGAAAWPNPGQGCSSYLVRAGATTLVLDCGPDTLLQLRAETDYTAVDAAIVSHCHADHLLDLVPWRYGLKYGPARPARPIPVWLPPGGIERMRLLAAAFANDDEDASGYWDGVFELREYDPAARLVIGDATVSFAPTQHFVPCWAMRVAYAGRSLVYTADTGTIDPLVNFATGVDLLIAEGTSDDHAGTPPERRGHLTPEDAGELAARARARRLLLSHLWSERDQEEVRARAARAFAGEIAIARAGTCLDV